MSREDIYLIINGSEESTFDKKLDFMEKEVLNKYDDTDEQRADVKHKLSLIKHQFKVRWQAAHKMKAAFEKNNNDWLNGTTTLPLPITGMHKIHSIFEVLYRISEIILTYSYNIQFSFRKEQWTSGKILYTIK